MGRFTDQAYNAILLAEDEARMLRRPTVEPEHLLLATARRGNVERLLTREGIAASDIHRTLVGRGGVGAELVLGPVPRSGAGEAVLGRAVAAAAERGIHGPSTEHLLLGLGAEDEATAVLRELGLTDVTALVDAAYPIERAALRSAGLEENAREAMGGMPPSPGPIPPVFERFTPSAARAVEAAVTSARELENRYVEPAHLLLGLLGLDEGVVATLRARQGRQLDAAYERAVALLSAEGPASQATGIFTASARRLLAEDVLEVGERMGERSLGDGQLLLAVLGCGDAKIAEVRRALPDVQQIAAAVTEAASG